MKTRMTTNPSTERKVATFLSLKDANKWLGKRDSIVILNLRVEYQKKTPPPRTMIRRIIIDYVSYPHSVNHVYGIDRTDYFVTKKSVDLNQHTEKWIQKNPDKEFVLCDRKTAKHYFFRNERRQLFLFRDKFLVLYKTLKDTH